jgi:hypothetical protein
MSGVGGRLRRPRSSAPQLLFRLRDDDPVTGLSRTTALASEAGRHDSNRDVIIPRRERNSDIRPFPAIAAPSM